MSTIYERNRDRGTPLQGGAWSPFGAMMPSDEMSAALARNWWAICLRAMFTIIFGLLALLLPGLTLASLVLLFGAYMLVDGVLAIISAVRAAREGERWGLLVFEGIADLAAGVIAFLWPLATVLAVVYLVGAWGIVSGILLLIAAFRLNLSHGRWLMALGGALSTCWGILLLLWPLVGAVVLTWWLGAYALVFGAALLMLGFRLRKPRSMSGPVGQRA